MWPYILLIFIFSRDFLIRITSLTPWESCRQLCTLRKYLEALDLHLKFQSISVFFDIFAFFHLWLKLLDFITIFQNVAVHVAHFCFFSRFLNENNFFDPSGVLSSIMYSWKSFLTILFGI